MDRLNKIFTTHIDGGIFPGVQWQINIKDETYSGKVGYNNIETKEPILDNTIYRIWSMTKPVVAIAALQLLEKNKLNLDDLVTKYLPEFSNLKVLKNKNSEIEEVEDVEDVDAESNNVEDVEEDVEENNTENEIEEVSEIKTETVEVKPKRKYNRKKK